MDPKKSDAKRKTDALKVYIEKQLTNGVKPKEIYHQLVEKNVPSKLATELVNQVIAKLKTPSGSGSASSNPTIDRQQKIINFIRAQQGAGKSNQEILKVLVQKKVSKEEAIELIRQVADNLNQAKIASSDQPAVSPALPLKSIIGAAKQQQSVVEAFQSSLPRGLI